MRGKTLSVVITRLSSGGCTMLLRCYCYCRLQLPGRYCHRCCSRDGAATAAAASTAAVASIYYALAL